MNIKIIINESLETDNNAILEVLNQNSCFLNFKLEEKQIITDEYIEFPKSQIEAFEKLTQEEKDSDFVFLFTEIPYINNYFFEGYGNFIPFSLSDWDLLTNLPKENGILFFIIDYLARQLKDDGFRHEESTGCIYDFLWDKTAVDIGMRQASLCKNCLDKLSKKILSEEEDKLLEDLKKLMEILSSASKWNQNISQKVEVKNQIIVKKRKPLVEGEINIVIASPSDLMKERQHIFDKLERKFRVDGHEDLCGFRIKIHGWEDLASQVGYAQDVINDRIITKMDIVIGLFKLKLGTPTINTDGSTRFKSGTVEEILFAIDNEEKNNLGMDYFFSQPPILSLDAEHFEKIKVDWENLKLFKKEIQNKVVYKPFNTKDDLIDTITLDLSKNIRDNFEKQ